jgi:HEAT repeats
MAKLQQIYKHLQSIGDACVDQAMAQAMPTTDRPTLRLMALVLLHRKRISGTVAIVENFHRLPKEVRQTVLEHAPGLSRALRIAMGNKKSAGPANAVQIIRRSSSIRQAYLIADQLRQGQDDLKDESARCLREMAQRTTPGQGSESAIDAREAQFVQSAIRDAVRFFAQHKRQDVLLALFSLPLPGVSELLASIGEVGPQLVHPTGVLLTRSDTPAVSGALLAALAVQPLHAYAVDGLRMAVETQTIGRALNPWHLMLLKSIRTELRRIKGAEGFVPGPELFKKPVEAPVGPGLAHWLAALPLDRPARVRHLGSLREAADPGTRLAGLRRLLELTRDTPPDAAVHTAIAGYCTDPLQSIARVALAHLIRCGYPGIARILAHLVNSPHTQVQRIAGRRLAPVAFSRLWESWPKLDHAQRIGAGRALIKIDPGFHTALHDKLALADRPAKLRALSIISELNQGLLLQDTLLRLSRDKDAYIVSAAVKALGSAEPKRAVPQVESALKHQDERVRANAIEALAQLDSTRHVDQLTEMAGEHEANRARANAIQALMRMNATDALSALSRMLADPRPNHRASALWLIETMGITAVAREVAEMSISEPDPQIKVRAGRVIQEVIEQLSQPIPLSILKYQDFEPDEPGPADHAAAG